MTGCGCGGRTDRGPSGAEGLSPGPPTPARRPRGGGGGGDASNWKWGSGLVEPEGGGGRRRRETWDDGRGEERRTWAGRGERDDTGRLTLFLSPFPAPVFTGLLPSLLAVFFYILFISSFLVWAKC